MEGLKESQDQKRRELVSLGARNLGNWGQSWAIRRDLNRQRERTYGGNPSQVPRARSHWEGVQRKQKPRNHHQAGPQRGDRDNKDSTQLRAGREPVTARYEMGRGDGGPSQGSGKDRTVPTL